MHQHIDCLFNLERFLSLEHSTYITKITWMKELQIENVIINTLPKSANNCGTQSSYFEQIEGTNRRNLMNTLLCLNSP